MAKEIIPPNPIPVGEDPVTIDGSFHCATMVDAGDQYEKNRVSRSEVIVSLLEYLDSVGTPWGTSDEFWKAYVVDEKNEKTLKKSLCNNVEGLTKKNLNDYLQILERDKKLVIAVFLV